MDSIGSRLRSARERANLSQEALARLLDVSSKTVFRIEHGEYEPSIALVRQIAGAVDGDADFILTGRVAPANDASLPDEAKTATFIRWVGEDGPANQALYRMAPALDGYDLVIASGIRTRLAHGCFLFAADEHGEITDWTELSGVRDTTDHAEAMANAGYEIVEVQ